MTHKPFALQPTEHIESSAKMSECGAYRYVLERHWRPELGSVNFIMLNPSTADANQDDPTIRRCIGFARAWGYGGLIVTNLFALRATDPKEMKAHAEPVGPRNDFWLKTIAHNATLMVAAWGAHGAHLGRADEVRSWLDSLQCLGTTKGGFPRHPLYLKGDTQPEAYG